MPNDAAVLKGGVGRPEYATLLREGARGVLQLVRSEVSSSFRALSGRLKFTVPRHKFNKILFPFWFIVEALGSGIYYARFRVQSFGYRGLLHVPLPLPDLGWPIFFTPHGNDFARETRGIVSRSHSRLLEPLS